jgi:predicted nucleotide-binding protein (sugar kinase/HSP70/actin superfamily)
LRKKAQKKVKYPKSQALFFIHYRCIGSRPQLHQNPNHLNCPLVDGEASTVRSAFDKSSRRGPNRLSNRGKLSDENRWVIMANLIPWEKFEEE